MRDAAVVVGADAAAAVVVGELIARVNGVDDDVGDVDEEVEIDSDGVAGSEHNEDDI